MFSHYSTADEWYQFGAARFNANKDDIWAFAALTLATGLDVFQDKAYYILGWIYEHGNNIVPADLKTAAEHYRCACVNENEKALTSLIRVNRKLNMPVEEWLRVGDDYARREYDLSSGVNRLCPTIARAFYEQAVQLFDSNAARQRLGHIYEFGVGVNVDLAVAQAYYECDKVSNKEALKRIERKRIQESIETNDTVAVVDSQQRTSLHRAAQYSTHKLYASLLFLGADVNVTDSSNKTPGCYLSEEDKVKVNQLSLNIRQLQEIMHKSAGAVVVDCILLGSAKFSTKERSISIKTIDRLYANPLIKPILDFVKLAAAAKHRLSGRPEVNDECDSDDEAPICDNERLCVAIDPNKQTLESIGCWGQDGTGGKYKIGCYSIDTPNVVYIGGLHHALIKGYLIHELSHMIAYELFDNYCRPYDVNDAHNRQRMVSITTHMKASDPPVIFKQIFQLYDASKYHNELIARVPEFLIHNSNGLSILEKEFPDLLDYYKNVFLEKLKTHTKRLEQKAIGSGWTPGIFARNMRNQFVIDSKLPIMQKTSQPGVA